MVNKNIKSLQWWMAPTTRRGVNENNNDAPLVAARQLAVQELTKRPKNDLYCTKACGPSTPPTMDWEAWKLQEVTALQWKNTVPWFTEAGVLQEEDLLGCDSYSCQWKIHSRRYSCLSNLLRLVWKKFEMCWQWCLLVTRCLKIKRDTMASHTTQDVAFMLPVNLVCQLQLL